jgi:2,7-dihydroxy-5-methyl-1-naphthoate 7-O-methyltransferase
LRTLSDEREAPPIDLDALTDLGTAWSLHVVATLRIADYLADGIDTIDELAAAASCDRDTLHRVLRHLAGKGVFRQVGPGQFALNAAAEALRDPGVRLGLDLDGIGGRMAQAWAGLLTAVRTGQTAYAEVFGRPFWNDLDAHPEVAASFDALMGPDGHGVPDPEILPSRDWESVRTVVDVGGGTGTLLAAILRAHPSVRGILVDLPRTVARSTETFSNSNSDVADRVTTLGQSFFDPLPAGADLYVLKNLLADWPDLEAAAILRRCAEAARPRGRVVVVGGVSADDAGGAAPELLMLVLVGGKARTLSEFRELAARAGLEILAADVLPSGRFAVECRPS